MTDTTPPAKTTPPLPPGADEAERKAREQDAAVIAEAKRATNVCSDYETCSSREHMEYLAALYEMDRRAVARWPIIIAQRDAAEARVRVLESLDIESTLHGIADVEGAAQTKSENSMSRATGVTRIMRVINTLKSALAATRKELEEVKAELDKLNRPPKPDVEDAATCYWLPTGFKIVLVWDASMKIKGEPPRLKCIPSGTFKLVDAATTPAQDKP